MDYFAGNCREATPIHVVNFMNIIRENEVIMFKGRLLH